MLKNRSLLRLSAAISLGGLGSFFTVAALATTATGCGSKGTDSSSDDNTAANGGDDAMQGARDQTQADYAQSLKDTDDAFNACFAAGACTSDAIPPETNDAGMVVSTKDFFGGVRPQGLISGATSLLSSAPSAICGVLTKIEGIEHLWFYLGVSGMAGVGKTYVAGIDLVYNLWDEQAAIFVYNGQSIMLFAGASASVYMGMGADFTGTANVIQGWSGDFKSASFGISAEFDGIKFLGASASVFCSSPSPTLCGVALSGDVGIAFDITNPLPLGFSGVSKASWYPWDSANKYLSTNGWFIHTTGAPTSKNDNDSNDHPYAQFSSAGSMALSILSHGGVPGAFAATTGLALAALKKNGLTIQQMCPNGADGGSDASSGSLVSP